MAKRFTDTALNRQPWFRKLKPKMKCAVRFLFDECDVAGVWVIDMETLSYFVGEDVGLEELFSKINSDKQNRIEMFGKDKIFIPGFISFQYGELTENCKPHRPIISLLKKYGLYERVLIGYQKGIDTLEEKEKEMEQEQEKDFGKSENLLTIELPANVLEAAEMNQFTFTQNRNTDFVIQQWKVFLKERTNDPPLRRRQLLKSQSELNQYFLNWLRNKKPEKNGTHKQTSNGSKQAGANQLLASIQRDFAARGKTNLGE
jgi:hypothetical protein